MKRLRDNYDVRIKKPIDNRELCDSLNDIETPYEGLRTYNKTDGYHYDYINSEFIKDISQEKIKLHSSFLKGESNDENTPMGYNSTSTTGKKFDVHEGSNNIPSINGNVPTASIQKVDESVGGTFNRHIHALQVSHIRKPNSNGYGFSIYGYMDDYTQRTSPNPCQSVVVTGTSHVFGNGQVWSFYGESNRESLTGIGTACELDAFNRTGVDDEWLGSISSSQPHSKGLLISSSFGNKPLLAIGVISGSFAQSHRVGLHFNRFAVDKIGIDIQSTPEIGIRLKNGCWTDGVAGGIGIDTGKNATYGLGKDEGAIHLWGNALTFGKNDDFSWTMQFNPTTKHLDFVRTAIDGTRKIQAYLDLSDTAVNHSL